jgi:hypothetical protein
MQLNYLAPLVSFQDGSATVLESKLTLFFKNMQTLQSKKQTSPLFFLLRRKLA